MDEYQIRTFFLIFKVDHVTLQDQCRVCGVYLVLLAGGRRGLDELLQDPQTHQGDVLHHHRRLDVHRHEEQAQGWMEERGLQGCLFVSPSDEGGIRAHFISMYKNALFNNPEHTTAQPELPAAALFRDGVCQQQHLILKVTDL